MTIREQLEHAKKYGYPVRVLHDRNEEVTGKVLSIGELCFKIDFRSGHTLAFKDIYKVEVSGFGDTHDVEIAEIVRDERWVFTQYYEKDPGLAVDMLTETDCGFRKHTIGQFTQEKYAKAAATLPDLVRQRDRLLEASKAVGGWLTEYPIGTLGNLEDMYNTLLETIADIEKNPLIRLTDAERKEVLWLRE